MLDLLSAGLRTLHHDLARCCLSNRNSSLLGGAQLVIICLIQQVSATPPVSSGKRPQLPRRVTALLSGPEWLLPNCDVAKPPLGLRMHCRQPAARAPGIGGGKKVGGSGSNLTCACRFIRSDQRRGLSAVRLWAACRYRGMASRHFPR
jgi:hypothetical protein